MLEQRSGVALEPLQTPSALPKKAATCKTRLRHDRNDVVHKVKARSITYDDLISRYTCELSAAKAFVEGRPQGFVRRRAAQSVRSEVVQPSF